MRTVILFFIAGLINIGVSAQTISGKVLDNESGQAVAGAEIRLQHSRKGTLSNASGVFSLTVDQREGTLIVSHIGYRTQALEFNENSSSLIIRLDRSITQLDEIQVMAHTAREGYTPIAFSRIGAEKIALTLGDRPLPEVMRFSPGVYASRDGGGSGDATLSIRGFQQENLAVLLNGIPINGAENGLVYWNNWMGLTEVARSIEFQRGIGASKIAQNSVGGTVNIITTGTGSESGGHLTHQLTDYGNSRTSLSYNSGEMGNGWSFSLLGSRTSGPGYVDATYVDGWAYFLSIGKHFGPKQRLLFTALGGPERHGQRNMKVTHEEVERYGHKYNKEWGHDNGRINNASENFYHKPHIGLTHYLQTSNRTLIVSTLYCSPGWGGGKWNDSYQYGPGVFSFRNASGQIDWDAIYQYNASHTDTATLANGSRVTGFSKVVQTKFLASHMWAGALSTLETDLGKGFRLTSGIHYRYFSSTLRQEVANLLGGKVYIDDYSWSLAGVAGRSQLKMPGDNIRLHNGALLNMINAFAQVEKSFGRTTAFIASSVSGQTYRRRDIYNYPDNPDSETVWRGGFDLKGGLNYHTGSQSNIYVNAAHFSRLPYYKFVFGNFNNIPVKDIGNEKVSTAEAGFNLNGSNTALSVSGYYTLWQDVSFLTQEYIQLENNTQTRAMVSGLDALHRGIETDLSWNIYKKLKISVLAGLGDWKWRKDVEAKLLNDRDVVVDTINVYARGLYVGGAPQLQAGFQLETKLFDQMSLSWRTLYYDRHYAAFDPAGRQNEADRRQAYRIPSYTVSDLNWSMPLKVAGQDAMVFLNVNNVFDRIHILKGEDGPEHNKDGFKGFWSFGRNFDMGLRLSF
ncbi:MAG TPA: TonB-dependent receptor [Bacteroidales bacterium]|nr:TonB-dependent receptor [Bacteroidales bacterium]